MSKLMKKLTVTDGQTDSIYRKASLLKIKYYYVTPAVPKEYKVFFPEIILIKNLKNLAFREGKDVGL